MYLYDCIDVMGFIKFLYLLQKSSIILIIYKIIIIKKIKK